MCAKFRKNQAKTAGGVRSDLNKVWQNIETDRQTDGQTDRQPISNTICSRSSKAKNWI